VVLADPSAFSPCSIVVFYTLPMEVSEVFDLLAARMKKLEMVIEKA
jgi:hypothetical protein